MCDSNIRTALDYMMWLRDFLKPFSKEFPGKQASKSEVRRWIKAGSVRINGKIVKEEDVLEFPLTDLVLFPKSDKSRHSLI